MLHKYSEVLNIPVICADNGKKTGTVKDILFSLQDKEVKGLVLESGGFGISKRVVMPDELLNLGNDAAIISSSSCVSKIGLKSYYKTFPDEGKLLELKVYSKDGAELGVVKDIIFDIQSRKIEGFEISDGLLADVIQGRKLLPLFGKVEFGEEFVIVESEAVDEMEITGGGIKNRLLR